MVRIAFVLGLLALLAAAPAPAAASPRATAWWFWLSKPEHHGSRKLAGDFTHINRSYRYHSRERRGLFAFLHRRPGTHNQARRHQRAAAPHKAKHMTL